MVASMKDPESSRNRSTSKHTYEANHSDDDELYENETMAMKLN